MPNAKHHFNITFAPCAKENPVLEKLEVTAYAAGGKSLAKLEGKVIFIEGAVPGDVVDVRLSKSKKDWAEGKVFDFIIFLQKG